MSLSDAEIESTRFHLGYGNLDFGAYPYTADGFKQLFRDVVGPNLTIGAETTASAAIAAGTTATVTPALMTGIAAQVRLVVDVGDAAETVVVQNAKGTAFTAAFANAHPASGYPLCVASGTTRLRALLHQADKAWAATLAPSAVDTAGLKKADEVEFYQGFWVLKGRLQLYQTIALSISSLTRVPLAGQDARSGQLEVY